MRTSALSFSFQSENQFFLPERTSSKIHVAFRLNATKDVAGQQRLPLNISLVMDRSGSMEGDKLNYVKKALAFVIEQMQAEDQLSIVTYDDKVEVLLPQQALKNKDALRRQVEKILSGNTTNLSGGMLEGFAQVKGKKSANLVNRVLLLSDGLANEGVTDPTQLKQLASNKFREDGIGLSTFGVGADYNEDLMTMLAEHGGGNYYFIDSADKIPTFFASELQGLLAVVAQRVQVKIHFPSDQVRLSQVMGEVHSETPGVLTVDLNDLFAGEERAFVASFELIGNQTAPISFSAELQYEDVAVKMGSVKETVTETMRPARDDAEYRTGLRAEGLDLVAQYVGTQLLEKAIVAVDRRDKVAAQEALNQARLYLETVLKLIAPSDGLKRLMSMLESYEQRLPGLDQETREQYTMGQKMSKSMAYEFRKRKA